MVSAQGFFKKNLEPHPISSDAVSKNSILVANGIEELPAFSEEG